MTDPDRQAPASGGAASARARGPASEVKPAPGSGKHVAGEAATASGGAGGPIGRTVKGRYQIKRLLGEGGMGGVYEAEHLEIGKRVAVKLVHALHARDSHVAARIKQEARSTSAIESEHIVQVFDAGEDDDLGLFLVMELLKGEDLANLLAAKRRLTPFSACTLVAQAAQGLARAHAAGIVHRDLKPANVFVCTRDDGSPLVKLVDFGIAKLVRDAREQDDKERAGITRTGMVIGTPQYMSPEQAQGLPTVDHRTDVYSLGAVLYEAIVGVPPFREKPTYEQTILQIMTQKAPRLRDAVAEVPPELDRLCAEMMAHDPGARPQQMSDVRERLLAVFPEIEGSRAPLRPASGELDLAAIEAADERRRRGRSGARTVGGGGGPATHSAVAVNADGRPQSEPPERIVPTRSRATGVIAVVGALALSVGIGAAALLRTHAPVAAKAAAGEPAPPAIAPAPPAETPSAPPETKAEPPATPAPSASVARVDSEKRAPRKRPKASPPASTPDSEPTARPVGGIGVSTEF